MSNIKNRNFEWLIHLLIWIVLFALPAVFILNSGRGFKDLFLHFWSQLIAMALMFYINYFFLSQQWLYKNKKVPFILVNLGLLLFFAFGRDFLISTFGNIPVRNNDDRPKPPFGIRFYIDFLVYLIPVAFAFAIQSGKRIIKIEAIKKEADNIKLQSELQHLKFQLQPHFFFNALNNIYSSIDIDKELAKTSIHSLSKLMRYFLQKSEEESVSLSEELDFLTKYIDLMKMRLTRNTTVNVHFPNQVPDVHIPPLILISLVENAFKHGVSASQKSEIDITLKITTNEIIFTAYNTNFPKNNDDRSGSGIGLSNLRKRLQLLYPDNHRFVTNISDHIFTVNLDIPLQSNKY